MPNRTRPWLTDPVGSRPARAERSRHPGGTGFHRLRATRSEPSTAASGWSCSLHTAPGVRRVALVFDPDRRALFAERAYCPR